MGLFDFLFGGGDTQPPTPAPQEFHYQPAPTPEPQFGGASPLATPPSLGVSPDLSSQLNVAPYQPSQPGGFQMSHIIPYLQGANALTGLVQSFRGGGQERAIQEASRQMKGVTGPALAAGKAQLGAGQSGQLTPAQQAMIDQFRNQSMARIKQYLVNAGIPESSALPGYQQAIDQQALAMAENFQQQNFKQGLDALGLAGNALTARAGNALSVEKEISGASESAAKAIQALSSILNQ